MLRSAIRLLGGAIMVLGAVILVWGGVTFWWGDPVTAYYTRREQRELKRELVAREASFAAALAKSQQVAQPDETTSKPISAPVTPLDKIAKRYRLSVADGSAIGTIRVPRLGLNMVMVEGTTHDALKKGPGRDARTFMPGEGELVYIAGHRTTYGAPFAHIDSLRAGDRIELRLPYVAVTYRVTRHIIVPADDLARLKSRDVELLALQACHPRFSARERYIVYARPIKFTRVD
jgi:sortase A